MGVPPVIIHFRLGFSLTKPSSYWRYPMAMETPMDAKIDRTMGRHNENSTCWIRPTGFPGWPGWARHGEDVWTPKKNMVHQDDVPCLKCEHVLRKSNLYFLLAKTQSLLLPLFSSIFFPAINLQEIYRWQFPSYLVVHPPNRKCVITPVIGGLIAPTKIPLKSPGWTNPQKRWTWVVRHHAIDLHFSSLLFLLPRTWSAATLPPLQVRSCWFHRSMVLWSGAWQTCRGSRCVMRRIWTLWWFNNI